MKKAWSCICVFLLCLSLMGCRIDSIQEKNPADEQISLESVCLATGYNSTKIQLDDPHVEVQIYTDESYDFSNRNEAFYAAFASFLKDTTFSNRQVERPNTDDYVYFSIYGENGSASFSIFETDIIEKTTATENSYYYCDGIYDQFQNTFGAFLDENQKYCRSAHTPILRQYEYVVYDKDYGVLEADCIARKPHLFYDAGIVHLWVQTGTGVFSRWAKFFDVENKLISPEYHGQTDYFGNLVCTTESSKVVVYDMFSGKQVYCLDKFEKPLADSFENICTAYFINNGTQIQVEYLNTDFQTETQIFNLPSTGTF